MYVLVWYKVCDGGSQHHHQFEVFIDEGCRFFPLEDYRDALKQLSTKKQTFQGLAQDGVYVYSPVTNMNKQRPEVAAGIIALQNVRDLTTYRIYGHMSNSAIPWHHSHFKNAYFLDADAAKVRSIRKACAYGKQRQTGTDSNQVHRLLPTVQEQSFSIDDFTCTHHSIRGYKYCDVMRDNAMQMIYCNFTKSSAAEEMARLFSLLQNLNSDWRVFDHAHPDPLNPRYIRMDPETGYRSDTMLRFMADHGYKI